MKLAIAKRKYKGDWLAFQFSDEATEEGRVVAREKDRHKLFQKIAKRGARVYITYAGALLPKEYSVIQEDHA